MSSQDRISRRLVAGDTHGGVSAAGGAIRGTRGAAVAGTALHGPMT